jgi:hypothetical protein
MARPLLLEACCRCWVAALCLCEEAPVCYGSEYILLDHSLKQSLVWNGSQILGVGSDGGGGTRDRSIGGG